MSKAESRPGSTVTDPDGGLPDAAEWAEAVGSGYDALSERYRSDDDHPATYRDWTGRLLRVLAPESRVLDVGCGCGVPVARDLTAAGHRVTGVDVSAVQIERARRLVPLATFEVADIVELPLPAAAFDAVVALYSLIHVPVDLQTALIGRLADALVDGGVLVATLGWEAWTGRDPDWMDSGVEMRWSQADRHSYLRWLDAAGLAVVDHHFVPDGDSGHLFVEARRRPRRSAEDS